MKQKLRNAVWRVKAAWYCLMGKSVIFNVHVDSLSIVYEQDNKIPKAVLEMFKSPLIEAVDSIENFNNKMDEKYPNSKE